MNIRKTRKDAHMAQMELASQLQLLGIKMDRPTIAKIELGIRPLSDIEIIAISRVLKISLSSLFGESEVLFNEWLESEK
jgi:transcriptional regulator with XRE-family HTH domain